MTVKLDFQEVSDKEELFHYLKQMLNLPDYFGNNMDALYDCLSSMEHLEVEFIHFDKLRLSLGEYAELLLLVFKDSGVTVSVSKF